MGDRLKEISNRYDYSNSIWRLFYEADIFSEATQLVKDMAWLISEVKRLNEMLKER